LKGVPIMDPKERRYETLTARRFDMTKEDWKREGELIRAADEKDGTLDFIEALFEDAMIEKPEYEW
jgi:hypothetical protein